MAPPAVQAHHFGLAWACRKCLLPKMRADLSPRQLSVLQHRAKDTNLAFARVPPTGLKMFPSADILPKRPALQTPPAVPKPCPTTAPSSPMPRHSDAGKYVLPTHQACAPNLRHQVSLVFQQAHQLLLTMGQLTIFALVSRYFLMIQIHKNLYRLWRHPLGSMRGLQHKLHYAVLGKAR